MRWFILLLLAVTYSTSIADEFRPLSVRISQAVQGSEQSTIYTVDTRIPNDKRIRYAPRAVLSSACEVISERIKQLPDGSFQRTQAFNCKRPLHGSTIQLDYGETNPGLSTLISVKIGSTEQGNRLDVSTALAAHQSQWQIPAQLDAVDIAKQYTSLGFKHLLTGFDHLLFVACLLFICLGRWKHLLITVTAFTVAHSLSLGLNAFGMLTLNVRAVEAIIALSIVYLAYDIVRHTLSVQSITEASLSYRYPATVAGVFGLLHGLGFANILNEFGLPQNDKMIALFSFNIGIELGQLAFIAALLGLAWILSKLFSVLRSPQVLKITTLTASYLVGTIAMYWTIERFVNSF